MKTLTNVLKKSWVLILALVFLSSCYDIVYVSQDNDAQANQLIKPKICVQVSNYYNYNKVKPYFGVILPEDWSIKSGFSYVQEINGMASKIGEIEYSEALSSKMQYLEPAPDGYFWWVGEGNNVIDVSCGVISTRPTIVTGNSIRNFKLDYMIGDDYNGLNFLRSKNHLIRVISKKTPSRLTSRIEGQSIELNWDWPAFKHNLKGYNVYRNGIKMNDSPLKETEFVDMEPASRSYTYKVNAEFTNGTVSDFSAPARVCYCPSGPSLRFTGGKEMAVVLDNPSLKIRTSITLESWVKFEKGGLQQPSIISKCGMVNSFQLYFTSQNAKRHVAFKISPGFLESKTLLESGLWYHIAAVYDGYMMRLYINGRLDNEQHASGNIANSHEPLLIGKRSMTSNDRFVGNIDEVRIWNLARTAEQIEKYQRLYIDKNANGLVGYWKMNDGCSYYGIDNSSKENNVYLMNSCWCSSTFPFVPDFREEVTSISVPVINQFIPDEPMKSISLLFKFNPNLLQFTGLDVSNTQLMNWDVQTYCNTNGYLKIVANTNGTIGCSTDKLVKINFHALQPTLKDLLDFVKADFNGVPIRTLSGHVQVTDIPGIAFENGWVEKSKTVQDVDVKLFPNPVKANATFTYNLDEEAYVELSVFNLTGQKISTVISEVQNAGNQRAEMKVGNLTAGVYMYVLQANNSKTTGKMIIRK